MAYHGWLPVAGQGRKQCYCSSTLRLQADVEAMDAGAPASGVGPSEKERELEALSRRHKQHLARIEQVLRLLENNQVCMLSQVR